MRIGQHAKKPLATKDRICELDIGDPTKRCSVKWGRVTDCERRLIDALSFSFIG